MEMHSDELAAAFQNFLTQGQWLATSAYALQVTQEQAIEQLQDIIHRYNNGQENLSVPDELEGVINTLKSSIYQYYYQEPPQENLSPQEQDSSDTERVSSIKTEKQEEYQYAINPNGEKYKKTVKILFKPPKESPPFFTTREPFTKLKPLFINMLDSGKLIDPDEPDIKELKKSFIHSFCPEQRYFLDLRLADNQEALYPYYKFSRKGTNYAYYTMVETYNPTRPDKYVGYTVVMRFYESKLATFVGWLLAMQHKRDLHPVYMDDKDRSDFNTLCDAIRTLGKNNGEKSMGTDPQYVQVQYNQSKGDLFVSILWDKEEVETVPDCIDNIMCHNNTQKSPIGRAIYLAETMTCATFMDVNNYNCREVEQLRMEIEQYHQKGA